MPGKTEIQWTDKSWNPVTGCTKVSAGCDRCYAATFAERFRGVPGHAYEQGFDLKLWPSRIDIPIRWTKPSRIFVNSMSDLFHADVPTDLIAQVFAAMALAPQHIFQVLTKRPRRMMTLLGSDDFIRAVGAAMPALLPSMRKGDAAAICLACEVAPGTLMPPAWPLPNVWVGTSVENQEAAFRIDFLVKTPAVVRFLSCEPLIGPLNLDKWLWHDAPCTPGLDDGCPESPTYWLDWIITGGESGAGFRPCDPDWVRSIRDQCLDGHVAYFHKQWGGIRSKAGGRELDGREWNQMPTPTFRGECGRQGGGGK